MSYELVVIYLSIDRSVGPSIHPSIECLAVTFKKWRLYGALYNRRIYRRQCLFIGLPGRRERERQKERWSRKKVWRQGQSKWGLFYEF